MHSHWIVWADWTLFFKYDEKSNNNIKKKKKKGKKKGPRDLDCEMVTTLLSRARNLALQIHGHPRRSAYKA